MEHYNREIRLGWSLKSLKATMWFQMAWEQMGIKTSTVHWLKWNNKVVDHLQSIQQLLKCTREIYGLDIGVRMGPQFIRRAQACTLPLTPCKVVDPSNSVPSLNTWPECSDLKKKPDRIVPCFPCNGNPILFHFKCLHPTKQKKKDDTWISAGVL